MWLIICATGRCCSEVILLGSYGFWSLWLTYLEFERANWFGFLNYALRCECARAIQLFYNLKFRQK